MWLVWPLAQVEPPLEQPDAAAAARDHLGTEQLLRARRPRTLAGRRRRELAQRVAPLTHPRRLRPGLLRPRLRPGLARGSARRRRLGLGAQQARAGAEVLRLR